jgi:hypothetical protein
MSRAVEMGRELVTVESLSDAGVVGGAAAGGGGMGRDRPHRPKIKPTTKAIQTLIPSHSGGTPTAITVPITLNVFLILLDAEDCDQ